MNIKDDYCFSNIYLITNKINNKKYVGQTVDLERRFKQHLRCRNSVSKKDRPLYRALNKYGVENFEFSVLERDIDIEDIHTVEKMWIKKLSTVVPNGYNLTIGGEGTFGFRHSVETKERLRLISIENGKLYGKKVSVAKKGTIITEEQRIKISNALKGRTDHIEAARDGFHRFIENMSTEEKSDRYRKIGENNKRRKEVLAVSLINKSVLEFKTLRAAAKWLRENTDNIKASHVRIGVVCDTENVAYDYKWKSK